MGKYSSLHRDVNEIIKPRESQLVSNYLRK